VLRRLDNLDKRKLAGCSSAVSEAGNDIPYMRHLVYNTNASGLEHNSAIEYKVFAA
jgi:hypothetical protein